MTKYTGATGAILLLQFLCAAQCIPLDDFYDFGEDAPEESIKLRDGHNTQSSVLYVSELINFFTESQDAVIVSVWIA